MSNTGKKTIADDFIERLSKDFRPKFINNVDNPTRLVDHLQCLEPIDEEIVRAQQTHYGAIHAASILYNCLVRKPDWIEDLSRALKDDDIKLHFLADELKHCELTVPVRWDITCINGHCSDPESDGSRRTAEETIQKQHVNPNNTEIESLKSGVPIGGDPSKNVLPTTYVNRPETSKECVRDPDSDSSCCSRIPEETLQKQFVSSDIKAGPLVCDLDGNATSVTSGNRPETSRVHAGDSKEELHRKRENLRQKMMEKVFSFMETKEDVPVVIHYMKIINTELDRIDCGSIIFSFYIDSLEALQAFEKMWRSGGLKKLLDKDVLDSAMIQELKAVGENVGQCVDDIKSELNVSETDIERCRARLLRTSFDILPFNIAISPVLMNTKAKKDTLSTREVAVFAFGRLPDELRVMIEDPFVSDRIERFYNSESLHDIFIREQKPGVPSIESVSQCFANWLNEELSGYLKDIDADTQSQVLCLAMYLVRKVEYGEPATIPSQPFLEALTYQMVYFPTDLYGKSFWFELVHLPSQLKVDRESLLNACKELSEKGLICQNKKKLHFRSALLRDMFVTKVVICSRFKGCTCMKTLTESFEYVQTLIGMYKSEVCDYINRQAVEFTECAFKTQELKEIGIMYNSTYITKGTDSSFYNQDLVGIRPLKLTEEVSDAGTKLRENLKKYKKTKYLTVHLSTAIEHRPESLNAALHWLNAQTFKYCHLIIDNFIITRRDIELIGLYLNATPDAFAVSMQNCRLRTELLTEVLQTGHFKNVRKLNIANNRMQLSKTQPLGLMHMRWLESLQIQNCNLGDEGMKVLALDLTDMANLRDINVSNNLMSSKGLLQLVKAFATNKRLTTLRIHRNYIGEEGSVILAGFLEDLILLEVLNISECGIGDKGSAMVAKSLVSGSLRKLSMRKNNFTATGSRAFFRTFSRPPYFEYLDFSQNCLQESSDKVSAEAALDLITRSFDEPFVEFLRLPIPLIHLSLWNTNIGKNRLFHSLKDYSGFRKIRYLCLQENNLTDDSVIDLTEYIKHNCPYLQHINLRQNRIGTFGAVHIAKALSAQQYLQEVLLDRNEIGDEGVRQIVKSCARIPAIELIDLSYNNVSQTMMETIENELELKELIQNIRTEIHIDDGSFSSPQEDIAVQDKTKVTLQAPGDEMTTDVSEETPYTRFGITRVTKIKTKDPLDENIFTIERKGNTFYITR